MAPGSVDQTGNYVFQVLAHSVNPGWAKDVPAWTIADGYDTMFTLWNPSSAAEDLMATFYFANGSGQYQLPIHLEAWASMNLDMAQFIALNEPDAKGHTFPAGTSGGSVEFSSPKGMTTTITLSVGAAEFNVENATCSSCCICCGGICEILVCPNPGYCPIQIPEQMYAEVYFSNGDSADITDEANWSTANGTIATVNNAHGYKGIVTGQAVGTTTLYAQFTSTLSSVYCLCNGYCYTTTSGTGGGTAEVMPYAQIMGVSFSPNPSTIHTTNSPKDTTLTVSVFHQQLNQAQTVTVEVGGGTTVPSTGVSVSYNPTSQVTTLSGASGTVPVNFEVSGAICPQASCTLRIIGSLANPSSGIMILQPSPATNGYATLTIANP